MATTIARSSSSSNGLGRRHEASTTTSSSSSSSTASAQRRRGESQSQHQAAAVPVTPGTALQFLASPAHHHHTQLVAPRRSVPSKWEDAEKWLRQSSSSDSDHHHHLHGNARAAFSRQRSGGLGHRGGAGGGGDEKSAAVAVRRSVDALRDAHSLALYAAPAAEVLLKDKFTDNEEPSKESFVFRSSCCCEAAEPAKGSAAGAGADDDDGRRQRRRDVGTEMTPLGSSCHTPLKSASPARHNTPASRSSGPLVPYTGGGGGGTDISELAGFRLAKLDLGARFGAHATLVGWSSKEEEEDVSKSLRHFEATVGAGGGGDCRWDDDDRAKSCIRYQREEAKIQAWVNLESAKAEAQSRKLEVKIQKMRCNLEEKLMRRMTTVQRRAGEWRATARAQHLQQLRRAAAHGDGDGAGRRLRATSTSTAHHRHLPGCSSDAPSCACFPCSTSNNVVSGGLLSYY